MLELPPLSPVAAALDSIAIVVKLGLHGQYPPQNPPHFLILYESSKRMSNSLADASQSDTFYAEDLKLAELRI